MRCVKLTIYFRSSMLRIVFEMPKGVGCFKRFLCYKAVTVHYLGESCFLAPSSKFWEDTKGGRSWYNYYLRLFIGFIGNACIKKLITYGKVSIVK